MNTISKAIAAAGAIVLVATAPVSAAPARTEISAILTDTTIGGVPAADVPLRPGDSPGSNWESAQTWHARNLPVGDIMRDASGRQIGVLERSVSFDWKLGALADGVVDSTARCSYIMELHHVGSFDGHCAGDLLEGVLVGRGDGGHQRGTYALVEGGVPGVGPYRLDFTVTP